jgi:regulator of protease activity HflC (stomatin/prohibitin superfamily)
MLLAEGEELLTFSMPIVYSISDPRAFLMSVMDPDEALRNLAYRQLLLHISGRDSFDVMTAQREELTTSLRREIQADIDRMNLGLEISFLGFKDVHPPVEVTDAYQMVISAREERNAMIDQARAYRAERLPLAQQEAERLRREADAQALARVAAGMAMANRFTFLQEAQSEAPELFRFRRRLETLDALLPGRRVIVVDEEISDNTDLYLDLNDF